MLCSVGTLFNFNHFPETLTRLSLTSGIGVRNCKPEHLPGLIRLDLSDMSDNIDLAELPKVHSRATAIKSII